MYDSVYISLDLFRVYFFFFNDTATTEIYTLSLHDALPISVRSLPAPAGAESGTPRPCTRSPTSDRIRPVPTSSPPGSADRKSTRLNSSHANISYAVFCLKKKKKQTTSLSKINYTMTPTKLS